MTRIISFSELEPSDIGFEFEGYKFGNTDVTFIVVNAPPGKGPKLHSHPYAEILIILEGTGLFEVGNEKTEVTGGHILIVPPQVPHKFINNGNAVLRQVDVHMSSKFITNWLEG
jgi:mannose-6-phosphate isomerase-like protein (cupin superfamily)